MTHIRFVLALSPKKSDLSIYPYFFRKEGCTLTQASITRDARGIGVDINKSTRLMICNDTHLACWSLRYTECRKLSLQSRCDPAESHDPIHALYPLLGFLLCFIHKRRTVDFFPMQIQPG